MVDAEAWDARYAATDLLWSAEPNRFVVAEVEGLAPGRAVDLAAGEARNAIWLAERGWAVTAIDYSAVALERAARLAEARGVSVELVQADVTTYALEARAYDLVLVAYLQTAERPRAMWLHRAVEAVAPGGTLLVIGHDRSNLDGGYGGPQDPAVLATPDEIAAAMDGLDVVKAELVHRVVETAEGDRVAIDHVVRARRR
ncbi:MAG TPA: class I SAM-dependent methyltransferase [Acidimicrobiia bacterium]